MLQSSNSTSGKTGKQCLPKPSATSFYLWNSFFFEQEAPDDLGGPPKPQLSYGSGKSQQIAISLPHTQVSMESYSYRHKGSSGIFSPNAVRWMMDWLPHGEETSYPMSQMNKKKSTSYAKHDWESVFGCLSPTSVINVTLVSSFPHH